MALDYAVIAAYVLGMIGMGWWGMRRATTKSEYLVAGRRLGFTMYSGTMSAVVLGGASTIGGVGLGYKYGISGAWMVFAIGLGILLLSALFARRIVRLKVYTVSQMLDLRYGGNSSIISGLVMAAYTLMLTVTSTIAYSTIFNVLFGLPKSVGVIIGGSIVVLYSVLGGMWSITLTDIVQFVVKTIGILFLLLPISLVAAGGFDGIQQRLNDPAMFDVGNIGTGTIITYLLIYVFGLLIGQDIWQRVFTAKSPKVAAWGGITSGPVLPRLRRRGRDHRPRGQGALPEHREQGRGVRDDRGEPAADRRARARARRRAGRDDVHLLRRPDRLRHRDVQRHLARARPTPTSTTTGCSRSSSASSRSPSRWHSTTSWPR